MADQFKVTTAQMQEMVEEGRVGFPEIQKAIASLTTGSGQFAGGIEAQSKTLSGMFSTLSDNVKRVVTGIGEGTVELTHLHDVLAGINGLLSQDPDGSDVADISDVLAKRAKDRAKLVADVNAQRQAVLGKANLAEWNKQTQITPAAKVLHDSLNEAEQELATLRMTAAEAKAYRVELAGGSKEAGDMVRKWWNQVEAEKAAVAQAKKLEAEVEAVEEAMVKRAEELDAQFATPLEKFAAQMRELRKLADENLLGDKTFDRAAKDIREKLVPELTKLSPLEEFKKRRGELQELLAGNVLNQDEFDKAIREAGASLLVKPHASHDTALARAEKGSQEAFSAIRRFREGGERDKAMQDLVAVNREQNRQLEQIAKNTGEKPKVMKL